MSLVQAIAPISALLATAFLPGLAPGQQASKYVPTPPFAGPPIPDPPQQGRPWTPPETKLPSFLVRAVPLLSEQGMADPRGCEYREVDVGDQYLITTHAFVLPTLDNDTRRFAVGWDGIIYPAFRVGDPADLDEDTRSLAALMKDARAGLLENGGWRLGRLRIDGLPALNPMRARTIDDPPMGPASVEMASAIKLVLLLRLGRADLAEALFAAGTSWTPDIPRPDLTDYHTSYLTIAQEWARRAYFRAVDAHGRGDDAIALDAIRRASRFVAQATPKIEAMGFPIPAGSARLRLESAYFPALNQLRALLDDQERRAREPKRGPIPGPEAPADQRVAALIRDLDQAVGSGGFMNGMNSPTGSAAEKALIREGDAAVGPLIDALESDNRLTRAVSYPGSRSLTDDRLVHDVYEAEQSALFALIHTRVIPGATHLGSNADGKARKANADAFRAYWAKYGAMPELERYYRTLADDKATPEQWLDAAEALTQPTNVQGRGGSYLITRQDAGQSAPARGESLRNRDDPGITVLIAKRAESIDPSESRARVQQGSGEVFQVSKANRMAIFLARWDLQGAAPTLKARVARSIAIFKTSHGRNSQDEGLAADLARMTLLRVRAEDPSALDDYAGWIRATNPIELGNPPVGIFEPMWRYPDHPSIAEAARFLFRDPASPWVPLGRAGEPGWQGRGFRNEIIASPLLGLDPFRQLILDGLADRGEAGSVEVDDNGQAIVRIGNGSSTYPAPREADPLRLPPSSRTPLRVADLFASALSPIGGFPNCEPYWTLERRDQVIARSTEALRRYGSRLRQREDLDASFEPIPSRARNPQAILAFDPLDRPATAEDVREGHAIFHLEGPETRVWPLPSRPIQARWTTLEIPDNDPGLRGHDLSKGRPRGQIEWLQTGHAWQAEETREGGRWQRYYGLVWKDGLARVPAEQVEFPPERESGWARISTAFDGRIMPPGGRDDGQRIIQQPVKLGSPLIVEAWLRNHLGLEAEAPGPWSIDKEGGVSIREGITIRLYRRPDQTPRLPAQPETELSARAIGRHKDDAPVVRLAPTATTRVLRIDLRDLFTIDAPGHYRLQVSADMLPNDEGGPGLFGSYFSVQAAEGP